MTPKFLLRWSLRDLRRRWLQVAAIAMVIAIGTGVYSALSGTATWRRVSNDESFAATGMYELRVRSTEGLFADRGTMLAVLETLPDPSLVAHAEERLIFDTQVDASTDAKSIRVPGRVIGLDVSAGGPQLTSVAVADGDGRVLAANDDGVPLVIVERNFADFYGLAASGTVRLGAGATLEVVGIGMAPEYFFITTEDGGFFAQANFAALFTSLTTAQQIGDRQGQVNDLVLRVRDDADIEALRADVQGAFDASSLGLGVTVMTAVDEDAYRVLYEDIRNDRKFWNVFAGLILAGAAFAAFNLASRMVDAQRREVGIGLALGASPAQLAWRPLLVGVEIGIAGVLLGIGVGSLAVALLRPVYHEMLPLPIWMTEFQWQPFLRGAALGFIIPVVATAWPVWRSTRMTPVDAIVTVHRSANTGFARMLRVLRWPRSAFRRMPIGNVLRAPRRTLLTALGIGAAVATLVAVVGMLDSFNSTMARNDKIVLADHPDRVIVGLDSITADDGELVASVTAADSVGTVSPVLQLAGHLSRSLLGAFGAAGLTNELYVVPAAGSTTDDVARELFDVPGVNSVVAAATSSQVVRDSVNEFTGVLRVLEGFLLLLALLIAYNATSINADERRRERATLFAFGLPVHRVMILEIVECILYGILGTLIGLGVGRWIHEWVMTSLLQSTMPDMRLDIVIGASTNVSAVIVGVVAVAVAPLLTLRRLMRMDVPGTLRVVE